MDFKKNLILFLTLLVTSYSLASADIFTTTGPQYDRDARNTLSKAAITIGAPFKLKLICAGLGHIAGANNSGTTPWGLLFTCPDKLTLEQAQLMAKSVTEQLLQIIYEDPRIANYRIEALKQHPKGFYPPLSNKSLALRFDFWDEQVNRPLYPYIAEIRLAEEKIYYYYADPKTQALQEPVLIETFSNSKSSIS